MFVLFTPKFLRLIEAKKNILFLSNWNLNDLEKELLKQKEYSTLENEWQNIDYKRKNFKNLKNIQKKLIIYIKDFYNTKFNYNYSEKFYKQIFSEWIWSYTHIIFDRIETVKKLRNYKNLELLLIDQKNFNYVRNNLEFINKCGMNPNYEYDNFNLQIYSILVKEYLTNKNYNAVYFENKKTLINIKVFILYNINKFLFYYKIKFINYFKLKYILLSGVYRESSHIFHKLKKIKNYLIVKLNFDYSRIINIDYKFRSEIGNEKNVDYLNIDDDNKIYFKLLKYFIPLDQCENFNFFINLVNKLKIEPDYIFSYSSGRYNSFASYINAISSEKKTKIYGFQHGGGYFMHDNDPYLETELQNSDLYFSFGYKDKNIIPFSNFKYRESKLKNNSILFITTDIMRGFNKIFEALEGSNFHHYFDFQKTFYLKLNKKIKKILKIKMYNHSFDNANNLEIFKKNSILYNYKLDDNLIDEHKLFIIDANQTVFLKILSKNLPFIILWNKSLYFVNEEFNYYLQKLKTLNIFFEDPNEAANYLNINYENHIELWYSTKVQVVIKEMINKYAKNSVDPQYAFEATIKNYLHD